MEIPLRAEVQCPDGSCGRILDIIVDRQTWKVTHIAVEDETLDRPPYQRMVAVNQIGKTTPDAIHLSCSKEELGHMPPFIRTRYLLKEQKVYTGFEFGEGAHAPTSTVGAPTRKVKEEMVTEGDWVVRRGTPVMATDGRIGQVGELVIDPDDNAITHLLLLDNHIFGKKEISLPVSAVDRAGDDRLYLKLDKQAVERLPAMPSRKHN